MIRKRKKQVLFRFRLSDVMRSEFILVVGFDHDLFLNHLVASGGTSWLINSSRNTERIIMSEVTKDGMPF